MIPLLVLIVFGSLDLLRLFRLTTLLDTRTEYLADYFSKQTVAISDDFGSLVSQLQLSANLDLPKLSGAAYVVRLQPDGGSITLYSEQSATVLADCATTLAPPLFQNENEADFFPSQTFVQISLCLKPENDFYLSPILQNLDPVIAAKVTRSIAGLSVVQNLK